jgi:hypothetical protein
MAALPEAWLPRPMDVVWSRFPYAQNPGVPGAVPHPALVFSTFEREAGLFSVQVAYGTSNLKTETRPFDFRVQNFRCMQYAGLDKATRFDLDNVKFLQWDSDWFESPDPTKYPTPVIGYMLDDQKQCLRRLLAVRLDQGLKVPVRP